MRRFFSYFTGMVGVALLLSAPASAAFGLKNLNFAISADGAGAPMQAGSHPFAVATDFDVNTELNPEFEFEIPQGALKSLNISIPPGLVGNPTAVPRCPSSDFQSQGALEPGGNCPNSSAVGKVTTTIGEPGAGGELTAPIYNLTPPPGVAASIGFWTVIVPYTFDLTVNPNPPYNVIARPRNIPQIVPFYSSKATLWGVPASPVHDSERGKCVGGGASCPVDIPEKPFLTMPTRCSGPLATTFQAESWEGESFEETIQTSEGVSGCGKLGFAPTIASRPTSNFAESPAGLDFSIDVDDPGLSSPTGFAQSAIEKAVVTLPEGMTTNPSVASGLSACSFAELESDTVNSAPGTGCPESSKVGNVEVETPLLEGKLLRGSLYVAKQGDKPFNSLLTIYMVIKDPELGIRIKLAGKVEPDPVTGQLKTTFSDLPQLPFSHFRLHFRQGERAPLITPTTCGAYTTNADLYPYANPSKPRRQSAAFQVTASANGSPCGAALPNKPSFSAGTLSPIAGAYSPLVFKIARDDGSQQFSSITTTLPKGLLGRLAGLRYCSEGQIATAQARDGEGLGAVEIAFPSCPASSEVGAVSVGSGAGSQPYYVGGRAYLAGPYKGAPLSLEIITPAIAGPFDLGVVAVRTALYVDQTTAQITAVSDRIPTILHGLPLAVRSIAINMNRPNFTLNPTGCEPKAVLGSVTSTLGQVAPLEQRFQVGSCAALGFKPKLALSLIGGTGRGGHPALKSVLTYPKGDYSNISRAVVTLPAGEFIDNDHINNPCTRVQFSANACPAKSILGRARAFSPLIDEPLEGPVYFRSNGGEHLLPDIVADLKGQIHVVLVGNVDSIEKKKGSGVSRLRTTFASVPDAPVSKFLLNLFGGKKGLLVNSASLCAHVQRAKVDLSAQNGRTYRTEPAVKTSCGKRSKKSQ